VRQVCQWLDFRNGRIPHLIITDQGGRILIINETGDIHDHLKHLVGKPSLSFKGFYFLFEGFNLSLAIG
jgi:hypothetical protein